MFSKWAALNSKSEYTPSEEEIKEWGQIREANRLAEKEEMRKLKEEIKLSSEKIGEYLINKCRQYKKDKYIDTGSIPQSCNNLYIPRSYFVPRVSKKLYGEMISSTSEFITCTAYDDYDSYDDDNYLTCDVR